MHGVSILPSGAQLFSFLFSRSFSPFLSRLPQAPPVSKISPSLLSWFRGPAIVLYFCLECLFSNRGTARLRSIALVVTEYFLTTHPSLEFFLSLPEPSDPEKNDFVCPFFFFVPFREPFVLFGHDYAESCGLSSPIHRALPIPPWIFMGTMKTVSLSPLRLFEFPASRESSSLALRNPLDAPDVGMMDLLCLYIPPLFSQRRSSCFLTKVQLRLLSCKS